MAVVQVFVKNQRQWRGAPLNAEDVAAWHTLRNAPGFGPIIAHATYLINLASPDPVLWERSVTAFADEMDRCDRLAIAGLVVHPGTPTDGDFAAGVRRVAAALDRLHGERPKQSVEVLLETTAGQGQTLGRRFDELGAILAALRHPERVGVCVDTCHVFAAGYDLRTQDGYAAMLAEAERSVGLGRIRCWHLNDSKADCGARVDRHEHIGKGFLGTRGFRHLLHDARFFGLPMILETPKGTDARGRDLDRINIERLKRIARR